MNWTFSSAIGFHLWEETDREFSDSLASPLERLLRPDEHWYRLRRE